MRVLSKLMWVVPALALATGCSEKEQEVQQSNMSVAPGAPGDASTWAFSGKTGIGTSYEAYVDGKHSAAAPTGPVSKVWFSVAQGILTETMQGMIHEAHLKDMQLVVVGPDFVDVEVQATHSTIEYLHTDAAGRPLSLAYKITNTDKQGLYSIEKHIFTDPDSQALYHRVVFRSERRDLKLFVVANPHVANTGEGDSAIVDAGLHASEGERAMSLLANTDFVTASVGFKGQSDLLTDLEDGKRDWQYQSTGSTPGNVMLSAELPLQASNETTIDLVLGFAESAKQSAAIAKQTLAKGYQSVLAAYNGEGKSVGWEDYLASLPSLNKIVGTAQDGGKLLHVSALVLKAQEDKTYSGALIASLSNPWGDTVSAKQSSTGYKAVWPRDFYQCAMAFLALGDTETPLVAFKYLEQVQVSDKTPGNKGATGWFLQKTHVNGDLEWVAVQLDQTAMPIMLGWKLWQLGVLSKEDISHWFTTMLKPAADFLVTGGAVNLEWNTMTVTPPYTQQERWEEQEGYSPSSMAAAIAGLVTAANIARTLGDGNAADKYLAAADKYEALIDPYTFTTTGVYTGDQGNGRYYLRISQTQDPNDNAELLDRNGRGVLKEKEILDGGFLELVRYGVRDAQHVNIIDTLEELDNQNIADEHRVKYIFSDGKQNYPGWRRYGDDGYGEDAETGAGYGVGGVNTPGQRGRVWPFFTGERGHYALAARQSDAQMPALLNTYVKGMEFFANDGLMLPEQVWDGVGVDSPYKFAKGEGTNSATPLAWTHAEYIKLIRSMHDKQVWDFYPIVRARYQQSAK